MNDKTDISNFPKRYQKYREYEKKLSPEYLGVLCVIIGLFAVAWIKREKVLIFLKIFCLPVVWIIQ